MTQMIFVDIDGTICITPVVNGMPNYHNSTPYWPNINKVNQLYDDGNLIVYWTARGAKTGNDWRDLTEQQLHNWGCKYHELRLDKPYFDKLYDDRSERLEPVDSKEQTQKT